MNIADEKIIELFFDINRLDRRFAEKLFGNKSPYKGQYRCLFVLEEIEPTTQKELAKRLSIRATSLSELLLKLENQQLVERKVSSADRRITMVSLTEKGKKEVKNMHEIRIHGHYDVLSGLSELEKEYLVTSLEKIKSQFLLKEEFAHECDDCHR